MLTLDPDSRATLGEVKNHPWFLMELSDLAESVASNITSEQVSAAKAKAQDTAVATKVMHQ